MGVKAHAFQAGGGEVRAVVAIQHIGQTADGPAGVRFPVDSLMQGKGGLFRRGGADEDGVPGDPAGVVIEDDRQPGPDGDAGLVEDGDIEEGVVDLPLLVGAAGVAAEHQLEPVPVGGIPVLGEGAKSRVESGDDRSDGGVARRCKGPVVCDVTDTAMDERRRRLRSAQG